MFLLNKFSLIILTRCNLKCRLCCEYVPQNKPFPDMTVEEEKRILQAAFEVADHINTLHLTGGGEPFLHPQLPELVEAAMAYSDQFDTLMLFTNCTIPVSELLMDTLIRYKNKILVQVSQYGRYPERESEILQSLLRSGIQCKVVNYSGENQDFGGWVDMGPWEARGRSTSELEKIFHQCSVTSVLQGNWRTRDGKIHWCSRSQRGMELGLLPDCPEEYVDLFDPSENREEKRRKFQHIVQRAYISACDRCNGDMGTDDMEKRYPAGEQM